MFRSYFLSFWPQSYLKELYENVSEPFFNYYHLFWHFLKPWLAYFKKKNLKNEQELNLNINEMTYPTQNRPKTT